MVSKPADYADSDLATYIERKAPATDLSGYSLTTDINEELLLKADKTSFEEYTTTSGINTILDDYADRTEVVSAIQFELGDYTTSADIDARFNEFSTDDYMPASRVNELLDEKDAAILTVDNRVYAIQTELSTAFDDPIFNISGIGNNRTFEQVVYEFAPRHDLSTYVTINEVRAELGDFKTASYIDDNLLLKTDVTEFESLQTSFNEWHLKGTI